MSALYIAGIPVEPTPVWLERGPKRSLRVAVSNVGTLECWNKSSNMCVPQNRHQK